MRITLALLILILFSLLTLTACGSRNPVGCHNCYYGPNIMARYDPHNCVDLPDGSWRCNEVTFNPLSLRIQPAPQPSPIQ